MTFRYLQNFTAAAAKRQKYSLAIMLIVLGPTLTSASSLDNAESHDSIFGSDSLSIDRNLSIGDTASEVLPGLALPSETETKLKRGVSDSPDDPEPLKVLAVYYTRVGRLPEALAALKKANELEPSDTGVALDIAKLAGATGGFPAARSALEDFRDTARDPFQFEIALVQLEHDSGDTERAFDMLNELIAEEQLSTRLTKLRLLLARYMVTAGDVAAARAQVDAIISDTPMQADALAFRALFRLNELDLEGAREDIANGLIAEPENPALLRLAARADWRAGFQEKAVDNLLKAAVASEYQPDIVRDAVNVLQETGRPEEALDLLRKAVDRHPDIPQLVARLGASFLSQKDWNGAERAATALRQFGSPMAVADSEKIRLAVLRGRGQEEEAQALLAQIGSSGSDISAVTSVINDHLAKDDLDGAMTYVEDLLVRYPNAPALLLMRASLSEMNNDPESAQAGYRAVIKSVPQSPLAYVALARHQMRNDQVDDAEGTLRDGLHHRPEDPTLKIPLVEILLRANEIDEALQLMENMVRAYPDNLLIANNYVALVTDYAPEDPASLERAASVAGQLRASSVPQLRDTYGWLLHKRGEHAAARSVLASVLEEVPDNSWANYHYGMVLATLGETEAALLHLRRAIATTDSSFDKAEIVLAEIETLSNQ